MSPPGLIIWKLPPDIAPRRAPLARLAPLRKTRQPLKTLVCRNQPLTVTSPSRFFIHLLPVRLTRRQLTISAHQPLSRAAAEVRRRPHRQSRRIARRNHSLPSEMVWLFTVGRYSRTSRPYPRRTSRQILGSPPSVLHRSKFTTASASSLPTPEQAPSVTDADRVNRRGRRFFTRGHHSANALALRLGSTV